MLEPRRISMFYGHYGSGKTHVAINYALHLSAQGKKVVIADLDIVNPYFRTKDSMKELEEAGISVISSPFAGSNVDLPSLPKEIYNIIMDRDTHFVLDIGGDDRGALALGRLCDIIREENDYEAFFVVNFYRPLTPDAKDAYGVLQEVQGACGIPATCLVNCSNLGPNTDAQCVLDTLLDIKALEEMANLPLAFTASFAPVAKELIPLMPDVFQMVVHQKIPI